MFLPSHVVFFLSSSPFTGLHCVWDRKQDSSRGKFLLCKSEICIDVHLYEWWSFQAWQMKTEQVGFIFLLFWRSLSYNAQLYLHVNMTLVKVPFSISHYIGKLLLIHLYRHFSISCLFIAHIFWPICVSCRTKSLLVSPNYSSSCLKKGFPSGIDFCNYFTKKHLDKQH